MFRNLMLIFGLKDRSIILTTIISIPLLIIYKLESLILRVSFNNYILLVLILLHMFVSFFIFYASFKGYKNIEKNPLIKIETALVMAILLILPTIKIVMFIK